MALAYAEDPTRDRHRRGARYREPAGEAPVWTEASTEHPCPLCGAAVGCSVMAGGEFARCSHAVSQWPIAGGGWLHRLAPPPSAGVDPARPRAPAGTR